MSPFRDAPPVELGPLDVGLEVAAAQAIEALPRGGRLIVPRAPRFALHLAGALGSTGLFGVVMAASAALAARWSPRSALDVGACVAGVIIGGAGLAAVMRALDHTARPPTRDGAAVRLAARRVLDRLVVLAARAQAPGDFAGRDAARLERALAEAEASDLADWIPDDVRGRTQLLLARVTAARGGPAWIADPERRDRVRALLASAARTLDDPTPARRDLAAVHGAPTSPRRRIDAPPPAIDEDELDDTARARLVMPPR